MKIEKLDDKMVKILKNKSGLQRLEIAFGLWKFARNSLEKYLRSKNPKWSKKKINKEILRRFLSGSINSF